MPEMHVQVQWPDGSQDNCYSPSLVIKEYLLPGETYALTEFVSRSRTALNIASDRVKAKYGFPCSRALGQLQRIETKSSQYQDLETPQVQVLQWLE